MSSVICVICYDEDKTDWSVLSCGHVFHGSCLSTWLRQNPICPQCKRPPCRNPARIYFATQEDRQTHHAVAAAAATPARGPEDPQEVEQLRQMLFMETQEKDVAWQHADDSEKQIARLSSANSDLWREAQRFASELDTCQMALIQQENQMEHAARLAAQKLKDSEETLKQLQLANCRLGESNGLLTRQLRSAEQQINELRSTLSALQDNDAVSITRFQTSQLELEKQIAGLKTELSGCKWQLELEQRSRRLEIEQLENMTSQKSQLAEQANQLQASYTALKSAANEEVNKRKAQCLESQRQLLDSERRAIDAAESLKSVELEKAELTRRLMTCEQEVVKLQTYLRHQLEPKFNYLEQQQGDKALNSLSIAKPLTAWEREDSGQLPKPWDVDFSDNFSDFPVFETPASATSVLKSLSGSGLRQSAQIVSGGDSSHFPPVPQPPPQQPPQRMVLRSRGLTMSTVNLNSSVPSQTLLGQRSNSLENVRRQPQGRSADENADALPEDSKGSRSRLKAARKSKSGRCKQM